MGSPSVRLGATAPCLIYYSIQTMDENCRSPYSLSRNDDLPPWRRPAFKKKAPGFNARALFTSEIIRSGDAWMQSILGNKINQLSQIPKSHASELVFWIPYPPPLVVFPIKAYMGKLRSQKVNLVSRVLSYSGRVGEDPGNEDGNRYLYQALDISKSNDST